MRLSSIFINVAFNDMLFVARGGGRGSARSVTGEIETSRVGRANDEHLCLIAVLLAWRDRAGTRETERD